MREFHTSNKTYVKSNNSTNKIIARYTYSLIIFALLTIIINLFLGSKTQVLSLIKSISLSFIITSIFTYIINVIKKEYNIKKIYTEDTTIAISIMIGLFSFNLDILILTLAIIVTLYIKNIKKDINLSSVLYGILLIILYKYFTNNLDTPLTMLKNNLFNMNYHEILDINNGIYNYLFGINYLSPVLSIIMFIYLFHKKGIKYNIVISYILTISIIMFLYGIFTDKMWFILFELSTGSLLFLTIYTLADYKASPTIGEAQILYGIILGIVTSILRLIIPELSVIITIIFGELLLSKYLENISYKLKYNKRLYNSLIIISMILIIITIIILTIKY